MIKRYLPEELSLFQKFTPKVKLPQFLDVAYQSPAALSLLRHLPEAGFAVVGTRHPQIRSLDLLAQTLHDLKNSGIIIVSGLARGVDSRAHELALDYGLKTIAILGCGIDVDYPRENRHLKQKILDQGGLIISEVEPNDPPLPRNFVNRNRLIAGFAKATWIVEAASISGTLNTAKWTMDLNRDLYATSCFPGDPFFQGNEKLLAQKDTHRYPLATPFFGAHTLGIIGVQQSLFAEPLSEIQKWIIELKIEFGSCQVQALMNRAYSEGKTLGTFYRQYDQELKAGWIRELDNGVVEISNLN